MSKIQYESTVSLSHVGRIFWLSKLDYKLKHVLSLVDADASLDL